MTDLLSRPDPAGTPAPNRAPSVVLAGALAAAGAAGLGLATLIALVLIVWATEPGSSTGAATAVRTAAALWLLAHHTGLALGQGSVGLVPLGGTVLLALLLGRVGSGLARLLGITEPRAAAAATGALAAGYGLLAAAVAGLTATPTVAPAPFQAVLGATALAALAGGAGVVRAAALVPRLRAALPPRLVAVAAGAACALVTLLGTGAVLTGAMLGWHLDSATSLATALGPGAVGGVALLLVSLALVPNAVVFAAAYGVGPGFAVGAGTSVSAFGVTLGPVPGLPLLAALPTGSSGSAWASVPLLAPLAAGLLAGVVMERRLPSLTRELAAVWGLASGVCCGGALGGLAWLAGGPAGAGRLATLGPSPWQVALATAAEVGVVAAAAACWCSVRRPGTGPGPDG